MPPGTGALRQGTSYVRVECAEQSKKPQSRRRSRQKCSRRPEGRPPGVTAIRSKNSSGAGRAAVRVDGRRVARGAELERARGARVVPIGRAVARPAGRQRRHRVQERTTHLVLRVDLLHEQGGREWLVFLRGGGRRAGGGGGAG